MIAGLIALLTILFFNSASPLYPIESIEKGIKSIEDKTLKKSLLAEIKSVDKYDKASRKKLDKAQDEFMELFSAQSTTGEDFNRFLVDFESMVEEAQYYYIDKRQSLMSQIDPEGWKNIVAIEIDRVKKEKAKKAKKKNKEKAPKVPESIASEISGLMDQLAQHRMDLEEFNLVDTPELSEHSLSAETLNALAEKNRKSRSEIFKALASFHQATASKLTAPEWKKISKQF